MVRRLKLTRGNNFREQQAGFLSRQHFTHKVRAPGGYSKRAANGRLTNAFLFEKAFCFGRPGNAF